MDTVKTLKRLNVSDSPENLLLCCGLLQITRLKFSFKILPSILFFCFTAKEKNKGGAFKINPNTRK